MRISPLGGIKAPQVVATNEASSAVHYKHFAMIQGIASRIKDMPGRTNGLILQFMDRWWERLEGAPYYKIAKAIEDDIDSYTLLRFPGQVHLQLLAKGITFPNERFQVDTFLCIVNGIKHGSIEILPIPIKL